MTTKGAEHRREQARRRRRGLIYRTLFGNYAGYECLPLERQKAIDILADSPYIDFTRLAEITGEGGKP